MQFDPSQNGKFLKMHGYLKIGTFSQVPVVSYDVQHKVKV